MKAALRHLWIVGALLGAAPAPARAQPPPGPSEEPEARAGSTEPASEPEREGGSPTGVDETPSDEETPSDDATPGDEETPSDDATSSDESAEVESTDGEGEDDAEDAGLRFRGRISGEYQHRFVMLSDFPLEPLPRTEPEATGRYGANAWGEQWLRLEGELRLEPILRLYGEVDLLWGVAYGDLAVGQSPAAWTREEYGYPGIRLRQLYLEWLTPIGLIRVGQQAFSWGLGIISNGGGTAPPFGDARFGDLVRRILFATRPAGRDSPFTIAVAGDWVGWDLSADFEGRQDLAYQGVVAAYYEEDDDRLGGYVAYRNQTNRLDDELSVFVGDLFAELHFAEPSGGNLRVAFELAYVRGTTSFARTVEHPVQDVEQLLAVAQLGRTSTHIDVILEGGYTSGDSNAEDGFLGRGTMDPDHRVGLILFPEILSAMTARSAHLASSPELFARPSRGVELLPTNGGVSGAFYFFPYAMWRPLPWIEGRVGAVLAWASTDVVDTFNQRARSRNTNYRGGDPALRDLGVELDGSVLLHGPIAEGVVLSGGVEGGVFFPGHAFDDAAGDPMEPVGQLRLRLGIRY